MRTLLKLAWRNILRNRRRTVLSALAVGIGLASMIFMSAFMEGMLQNMLRTATDTFPGQGQIHASGFRDTFEVENTINNFEDIMSTLADEPLVKNYTPRTITFGMVTSPEDVQSVLLYGIDPLRERGLSVLHRAIINGIYPPADDTTHILIGSRAAETLNVVPGDRVVVTVAQANTGELSQEMFRVGGIFHFNVREIDTGMAYIHIDAARRILGTGNTAHEIALTFNDLQKAGDRSLPLWDKYSRDGNEGIGWRDIIPQIDGVFEMSQFSTLIISILVFGIVGLTIMNTLFMSLYERMYEFGVLRAIGTRPTRMAALIMIEAEMLSLVSIVFGLFMSALSLWLFSRYGIDYTGIDFAGVTFTEPIYPVIRLYQFTLFPLMVMSFSLIAAIYPAFYAARLSPSEAMRRSM
jgi:ABC-type lipoprotein release transport system permease subunit